MENNVIHSFIRVFLDHWIGVYDDIKKKSKQKIMTKIIKKNSLGNLATHEKVLFVLPPNTFLTKK